MKRQTDLIVPVRDRRRHKRYLTLRNGRNVALAALALFTAITIISELRAPAPGEYGRLLAREIGATVEQKPVEVVRESSAPVPDESHADPMLVAPMARSQWLEDDGTFEDALLIEQTPRVTTMSQSGRGGGIAVVGGPDGVTIVHDSARKKPVLSGGFGR